MSASAKKKLRKEQTSAQLTEKQLKQQKETKKLKAYTTIFVVAIAIVLVAGILIAGMNIYKNSGIREKNTIAATVGDHDINSVQMAFYYADTIDYAYNSWYSAYGESTSIYLALMGLDLSLPLNEQMYAENVTWADYFVETALATAQRDYLLADQAAAEGFTMSESAQATLDNAMSSLSLYATAYGFSSVDQYLLAMYGPGADEEAYREYAERSALATDYYDAYYNNLGIDDAAIRAREAENFTAYSSFAYANYTLSYSYFLTGGTEDENGNMVYTEEEKDAARAAAKAAAESLPECSTVEELNAAIAALNLGEDAQAEATVYDSIRYDYVNSNVVDWMSDMNRAKGDFTIVANENTATDADGVQTTTVSGYTVYVYLGRDDNTMPLANVRHILVNFEHAAEEHTHDEDGNEVYSEEEKAVALEKAENLLQLFESGLQSEEIFAELATANSDDTASASNGGLFQNVSPEEGIYVESFTKWATDPAREAGDTDIIESEYGYHVMYYVGDSDITYRDSMIRSEIVEEKVSEWYDAIMATGTVTQKDTSLLNKALVLAQQ